MIQMNYSKKKEIEMDQKNEKTAQIVHIPYTVDLTVYNGRLRPGCSSDCKLNKDGECVLLGKKTAGGECSILVDKRLAERERLEKENRVLKMREKQRRERPKTWWGRFLDLMRVPVEEAKDDVSTRKVTL